MADGDDNNGTRTTSARATDGRVKRRRATADGEIVENDVYGEPPKRASGQANGASPDGHVLDRWRDRMGSVADDVVATEAGVTRAMVGGYRRRYGIKAYQGYKWEKGVGPPRRKGASGAPSSAKGVSKRSSKGAAKSATEDRGARRKRGGKSQVLEGHLADLGKVPDELIAARAGLSRGVVGRYRRERGIAAYDGYKFQDGHGPLDGAPGGAGEKKRRRGRPPGAAARKKASPVAARGTRGPPGRLSDFADLIGTVPDAEIAAMAGVSRASVATWRHRRGVPPAARTTEGGTSRTRVSAVNAKGPRRRGRPPGSRNKSTLAREAAAALAAGRAAPADAAPGVGGGKSGLKAYVAVVTRRGQRSEYITVGASLVEAAARVAAALVARSGGPYVLEELRVLGLAL